MYYNTSLMNPEQFLHKVINFYYVFSVNSQKIMVGGVLKL